MSWSEASEGQKGAQMGYSRRYVEAIDERFATCSQWTGFRQSSRSRGTELVKETEIVISSACPSSAIFLSVEWG
jgi:hypothetical protein